MNFTKKWMCFAPCVNGDTFLCYLGSIRSFAYYRHTIPQEGRMVTAVRLLALLSQITKIQCLRWATCHMVVCM